MRKLATFNFQPATLKLALAMRKLLPLLTSAVLFIITSCVLCAQPAPAPPPPLPPRLHFPPGQPLPPGLQFTNAINNARARFSNEINKARANMRAFPPPRSLAPPPGLPNFPDPFNPSNRLADAIIEAYTKNDFTNAAALLKEFPGTIDDLSQFGQPLLYRAVEQDQQDKLAFLLEHKASPDATASYGESALIHAIQCRRFDAVAKLIEAGASLSLTNRQGQSAGSVFFETWYPGDAEAASLDKLIPLMLEHGLDPFAPSRSYSPHSSILEACLGRESSYGGGLWSGFSSSPALFSSSSTNFSDLLLTNNPSPARRTPSGDTALHVAVSWQRTNAIEFLLAAGFSIDQTNDAGLTPLQSLVASAAPGGYQTIYFGSGSLVYTSGTLMRPGRGPQASPQSTMVDYLLAKGAALDVFSAAALGRTNELDSLLATNAALANARDGYGRTPLHYATFTSPPVTGSPFVRVIAQGVPMVVSGPAPSNPQPDTVSLLIKAGANPSVATTKTVPQFRNAPSLPLGTTPLHLAARNGNTALIRSLLAARADATLIDENGDSALHHAARSWATNALPLLLTARAPLEATNRAGHTPLRAAVEASSPASVEVLLKAGANLTNGLGKTTLLHIAAGRGDVATATILLKHGLALDARDGEGRTPFQKAAAAKQWNCVVYLKNAGADINAIDNASNSALHLLSQQQDDSAYHKPEESSLVEWERRQLSSGGWTGRGLRFLMASKVLTGPPPQNWTNTSLSTWLIEHGAKVNLTNRAGQTPLHVLCSSDLARWLNNSQCSNRVMSLLNAGASLDLCDTNGLTPLHVAVVSESTPLFKFLLSMVGPRVNLADAQGRTLLHHAVERGRNDGELVRGLLAAGADPNLKDKQGRTPLHLALRLRNDGFDNVRRDLVFTLLTNKANPNLADNEGQTPLHVFFQGDNSRYYYSGDLVSVLLTNGANPNAVDRFGRTPLHVLMNSTNAYAHSSGKLRGVLENPGWNFAARDSLGQTPIHLWAAQMENSWDDLELFKRILTGHNLVNVTNVAGDTPLHVAIRANKDHVARALMQINADPLLKNRRGETALRLALEKSPGSFDQDVRPAGTQNGFFDDCRFYRDGQDANLWLAADPTLASVTNKNGITPLMAATDGGNSNIVARLLELGAPLDALSALRLGRLEDFRKLLPEVRRPVPGEWMFEAVRFGQLEGLQTLLTTGGDVHFADADGHSLLFRARAARKNEIADWLSAQGCRQTFFDAIVTGNREQVESFINADAACINTTNRNSRPPLYRAAAANKAEMVALLLEHGAPAGAPIPGGWTALHAAAANDSAAIGQLLLKAGASPNAVAQGNLAPLHLAAALGCTNMAELLLQNGADVNLIPPQPGGYSRNTPLHWAAHLGRLDVFKLLLAHGADLNALNQQNQTPLEFARATARGQHWGFNQPPETPYKRDQTMFQPATRDAMIQQLEAAATVEEQLSGMSRLRKKLNPHPNDP